MSKFKIPLIVWNAVYLLGERWMSNAVRVVYVIVLARRLGSERYGVFNYGMSWYLMFMVSGDIGLKTIISRAVGQNRAQGEQIISQTFAIYAILTILTALLCGGIGWWMETQLTTQRLILIFTCALTGRWLAVWNQGIFIAYEANRVMFGQNTFFRALEVVVSIFALLAGSGMLVVAGIHALSWWAQAIYGFSVIQARLTRFRWVWNWPDVRVLLAQGGVLGGCGALLMLFQQGPLVAFRYLSDAPHLIGQFALVLQVFLVFGQIPVVSNIAALPGLSRSVSRQDGKDRLFIETILRFALLLGTILALFGISWGPAIIRLLVGDAYAQAGRFAGYALWLLIPWTFGHTLHNGLLARGKYGMALRCLGIGTVAFLFALWFLAPSLGISGMILAMAIGMGLWAGMLLWQIIRAGELNWRFTLLKPGIAVLITVGVFYSLIPFHKWLALPAAIGALLVCLILGGGFSETEKTLFRKACVWRSLQ